MKSICVLKSHESDSNGGSNTPKNELNPKKGQNPNSSSEYPSKFCKLPNLSAGSPSLRLARQNVKGVKSKIELFEK